MIKNDTSSRAVIAARCDMGFSSPDGGFTMENMRVLPDGSAELRCGFVYKCTLPAAPRTVLEGSGDDDGKLYAAAGNGLYIIDPDAGSCTRLATLTSSGGKASLFRFGGSIYLLDGGELWQLEGGTLKAAAGYIPLYGKDWDPASFGKINEPVNLLSHKIRIHYRIDELSHRLRTGIRLASIDSFEYNGQQELPGGATGWQLGSTGLYIDTNGLTSNSSVIICATLADDAVDRSALTSCVSAAVAGDGGAARICCYGGTDPAAVFSSLPVSASALDEARRVSQDSGSLYFPVDGRMTVGDGGSPVTGIEPCRDSALLFTPDETYRMSFGSSPLPSLKPSGCGVGLAAGNAAAGFALGAAFPRDGRIYVCDALGTPTALPPELTGNYTAGGSVACYCRRHGEVWFCSPDDTAGRLAVINVRGGAASASGHISFFTGAYADALFALGDRMGFLRGRDVYMFDPAAGGDIEPNGTSGTKVTPITGYIESPFFDFGKPSTRKRLQFAGVDVRGGGAYLTVTADSGRSATAFFHDSVCASEIHSGVPTFAAARINTGVFHSLRYRVSVSGAARPRVFGVSMTVRR